MYKIIGANQQPYGPVTADQVRQWIAEGRADGNTQAQLEGTIEWRPLRDFPEFAASFAAGAPPPPPPFSPYLSAVPGLAAGAGASRESALRQVSGPAIGLIVVGALGLAQSVLCILGTLMVPGLVYGNNSSLPEDMRWIQSGPAGALAYLPGLLVSALIVFGGIKMRRLESSGLAMTASILAMLPCTCACLAGLPIGIWSLVILSRPEVKQSFT